MPPQSETDSVQGPSESPQPDNDDAEGPEITSPDTDDSDSESPSDGRTRETSTERITVRFPQQQAKNIEDLVESGFYPSQSELVRSAVRQLLVDHHVRQQERPRPDETE